MEKIFSFAFPTLTVDDRALVTRLIRAQRVQILKKALAAAKSSKPEDLLTERAAEVIPLLGELVSLSKRDLDRFMRIFDGWLIPFCLSRLLHHDQLHDRDHLDRIVDHLLSLRPIEKHGSAIDSSLGHYMMFGDQSAESHDFPIIEETTIFGKPVNRIIGAYDDTRLNDRQALTLKDSLIKAQKLLGKIWPEAMDWVHTIVPAFVDLGIQPTGIRLSASYESGSPVFLSRVEYYYAHAEDLVHELQHQRFSLFAGAQHFKSWEDLRCVYLSPYRPDPRPLRGNIIGLHAFLTVNDLRKRMILDGVNNQETLFKHMVDLHYQNLFAFRTIIEHEKFGRVGRVIFKEMAATITEHHSLIETYAAPNSGHIAREKFRQRVGEVQQEASDQNIELINSSPLYLNWDETIRAASNFVNAYKRTATQQKKLPL